MLKFQQNLDRIVFSLYGFKIFDNEKSKLQENLSQARKKTEEAVKILECKISQAKKGGLFPVGDSSAASKKIGLFQVLDYSTSVDGSRKSLKDGAENAVGTLKSCQWRKIREDLVCAQNELNHLNLEAVKKSPRSRIMNDFFLSNSSSSVADDPTRYPRWQTPTSSYWNKAKGKKSIFHTRHDLREDFHGSDLSGDCEEMDEGSCGDLKVVTKQFNSFNDSDSSSTSSPSSRKIQDDESESDSCKDQQEELDLTQTELKNWNLEMQNTEKTREHCAKEDFHFSKDYKSHGDVQVHFPQWLRTTEASSYWNQNQLRDDNLTLSEDFKDKEAVNRQASKEQFQKEFVPCSNSKLSVTDEGVHQKEGNVSCGNISCFPQYCAHENAYLEELELASVKLEVLELAQNIELLKNYLVQDDDLYKLRHENERLHDELSKVKENYFNDMVMRSKKFNLTEDFKRKIRVFCRIKPNDTWQRDTLFMNFPDEYTVRIKTAQGKYKFMFDGVFTPQHTQEDVYKDIKGMVQSVLDGHNQCIFAYGQTGSGKTHTLVGNIAQPGIAPRAFKRIFELVRNAEDQVFRISVTILELYNEKLIDLLKQDSEDPKIRVDRHGMVHVEGSANIEVYNEVQLLKLFEDACKHRHTASTRMNMRSSRSHLIATVTIASMNKKSGTAHKGKLSIVDLAGSERTGKSAVAGKHIRETNSINKSLSALGDVIAALTLGYHHIPYRNNKLTRLMQDSLGGTAKTLMFVTISSSKDNIEESLNSLRYATRVKKITNSDTRITKRKNTKRTMPSRKNGIRYVYV